MSGQASAMCADPVMPLLSNLRLMRIEADKSAVAAINRALLFICKDGELWDKRALMDHWLVDCDICDMRHCTFLSDWLFATLLAG